MLGLLVLPGRYDPSTKDPMPMGPFNGFRFGSQFLDHFFSDKYDDAYSNANSIQPKSNSELFKPQRRLNILE